MFKCIREFTWETNFIILNIVGRASIGIHDYRLISISTLERNHTNVILVAKALNIAHTLAFIVESKQERNLINVRRVRKASVWVYTFKPTLR